MPIKIKDPESGQEREVYTPEEVEAKQNEIREQVSKENEDKINAAKNEAIENYKKEHPDQTNEINNLKDQLASAEAELQAAEGSGNEGQIKRLREERDNAKNELKNKENEFNQNIKSVTDRLDSFEKQRISEYKSDLINKYAKGDEEMKKKIELEFDNYRPNDVTREDIADRVLKAAQLSGAFGSNERPGLLDGGSGADSRGDGFKPTQKTKWSDNANSISKVLGITDEDKEKFGKK